MKQQTQFENELIKCSGNPKCVQCGYCCKKAACQYGVWSSALKQCLFLTDKNLCSKYDEIIQFYGAVVNPAFGAGCSSPMFNEVRNKKLMERK